MMIEVNGRLAARRPAGADAALLRNVCRATDVPYESTAQADPDTRAFAQRRAFEALEVAAEIGGDGFNVFATGPSGSGRRALIGEWLRERAATRPAPPDLVALHNFEEPRRPHNVPLPTGSGKRLAGDVSQLIDDARRRLDQAFESESYRTRHRELHDETDRRRGEILGELQQRAHDTGVAIQITPAGVVTAPIAAGRALTPDEIESMPQAAREHFDTAVAALKEPVDAAFATMHDLDRDLRERHRALNRDVALFAIGRLVQDAQDRWSPTPRVVAWLDAVREDVIDNLDLFRGAPDSEAPGAAAAAAAAERLGGGASYHARFVVNVLVDHDGAAGAPVIVATDPSYYELFGRVEYETAFGAAVTDHRHLRAGLVHQASGGFLVLRAAELLSKPLAWTRLKEMLRTGRLTIENVAVQYMLFPGVTLDPEPAAIDLTVVLVGSPQLYELLHALDDDVARLFKLRADFDDEMPRDDAGVRAYAGLLARLVRERGLLELDRGAIAAAVEYGSRLAGHRERLSTNVRELHDAATEAAHIAAAEGAEIAGAGHVAAALAARRRRSDLVEERLRTSTLEGTVDIAVAGDVIGQVNGLAVAALADHAFGHPVRITATVAPGEGEVVDIDREARLSGPLHAKGVLILSGYLAGRYFLDHPMTLRASIVFEQSYGPVEGDSASTAELLALLSALARLPVDQSVAVTGAVDQHGAVHAVGAINEKVEGFFALCAARGLSGEQGVVVPEANLPHLMLDERVVDAVRDGRFHVWPVRTVDEALELITGCDTAGERVRDRLVELSRAARKARAPLREAASERV